MIRYALICQQAHDFDSWFPSGSAFEEQHKQGLVTCPVCGSHKIEKQIMAPSVLGTKAADNTPIDTSKAPHTGRLASMDEKEHHFRQILHNLHEYVQAHSENVGHGFPEEARKIHYGESEQRSIHGEASPDEVRSLFEEGIDFIPLPPLPEKQN